MILLLTIIIALALVVLALVILNHGAERDREAIERKHRANIEQQNREYEEAIKKLRK